MKSRSSRDEFTGGAPGEAKILALNPQRAEKLCALMGWSRVEPGTLNLKDCDTDVGVVLERLEPLWTEKPETIVYPKDYEDIPHLRGGYRYYAASVASGRNGGELPVVLRRPVRMSDRHRRGLEVFAEVNLRKALGLTDGDSLSVVLLVDDVQLIGEITAGCGRFSVELVVPGRDTLADAPWNMLHPGTLNVRLLPTDSGGRPDISWLDDGTFRPCLVIPHDLIQNNTLQPTQQQPLRGTAQVWRTRVHLENESKDFDCWTLRRIGSGYRDVLELVAETRLRDIPGVEDGCRARITMLKDPHDPAD